MKELVPVNSSSPALTGSFLRSFSQNCSANQGNDQTHHASPERMRRGVSSQSKGRQVRNSALWLYGRPACAASHRAWRRCWRSAFLPCSAKDITHWRCPNAVNNRAIIQHRFRSRVHAGKSGTRGYAAKISVPRVGCCKAILFFYRTFQQLCPTVK